MFLDGSGSNRPADRLIDAMNQAAELAVVVQDRGRWLTFYTHITSIADGRFSLLLPRPFDTSVNYQFQVGTDIGISFRLAGERLVAASTIIELGEPSSDGIARPLSVSVAVPAHLAIVSNRVYRRVQVPADRNVSCFLWPGGTEIAPSEDSPQVPSWFGKVLDLSIGGCRILAHRDVMGLVADGDIVGMIIESSDSILFQLDAHLTRIEPSPGDEMFYGLRFSLMRHTLQAKIAAENLRKLVDSLAA